MQGGSQENLAAIPETREFVSDERSLWTGLEPRDKASVNYLRAQKAREAVFKGTPFARRFLEDRPGKQARASFARDEAVRRVAAGPTSSSSSSSAVTHRQGSERQSVEEAPTLSHAPTTEFESVAPTHPATSVYYSSDEEVEVQVEEEPESSVTHLSVTEDTSRATATSAGSSSWYNSRAGSDIWRRDETRRNEQWERYQPYHANYRWQRGDWDNWWETETWKERRWGRDPH